MEICSDNHEEICYASTVRCPCCEKLNEIENLKEQIEDLGTIIDNLKKELNND